jgi:hypothetical protein
MSAIKDLTGQVFGRLTAIRRVGSNIGNYEKSNCAWQNWIEQRAEQKIKKQLKFLVAA